MKYKIVFTSNIPIDCHILKGRLLSDGIDAFIYDENIVWVNPFKAVAIGGVKLIVPITQEDKAIQILESVKERKLRDEAGEYDVEDALSSEFSRQNELLRLKAMIRKDASLLEQGANIESEILSPPEISDLIKDELAFVAMNKKTFCFDWKQFWYELLDFDRSVFRYLSPIPVEYFLEKDLVDSYVDADKDKATCTCPKCKSDNTNHGYAIDFKWDVLYLILSLLIITPFPLVRKKYHCFNCGFDFHHK